MKKPHLNNPENKSDRELAELIGNVKQIKQVSYKANKKEGEIVPGKIALGNKFEFTNFITTYDEKGAEIKEHVFGKDGSEIFIYNEKGQHTELINYNTDGSLHQKAISKYNDRGNMIESISHNADGSLYYRTTDTYNEQGKPLEHIHYK